MPQARRRWPARHKLADAGRLKLSGRDRLKLADGGLRTARMPPPAKTGSSSPPLARALNLAAAGRLKLSGRDRLKLAAASTPPSAASSSTHIVANYH